MSDADFEPYVRAALGNLMLAMSKLSDNVGDIHARVIVHDTKVRDIDTRLAVLESKKGSSSPPHGSPPASKLGEWYREESKVFRVPEEEMNVLMAEMQRRESAGRWEATVRFLGRVGAPVLAAVMLAALTYLFARTR